METRANLVLPAGDNVTSPFFYMFIIFFAGEVDVSSWGRGAVGGGGCRLRELKGVREYSKQRAGRKSKFKLAVGTPTENTGVQSWGNPDSDAVYEI